MKDPTYGQVADALRVIRHAFLEQIDRNKRFDRLFGEQLRPLHDAALTIYFVWLDNPRRELTNRRGTTRKLRPRT
jgi:hypothetical protein